MTFDIWTALCYSVPVFDKSIQMNGVANDTCVGYTVYYEYYATFVHKDDIQMHINYAPSRAGNSLAVMEDEPDLSRIGETAFYNIKIVLKSFSPTLVEGKFFANGVESPAGG